MGCSRHPTNHSSSHASHSPHSVYPAQLHDCYTKVELEAWLVVDYFIVGTSVRFPLSNVHGPEMPCQHHLVDLAPCENQDFSVKSECSCLTTHSDGDVLSIVIIYVTAELD